MSNSKGMVLFKVFTFIGSIFITVLVTISFTIAGFNLKNTTQSKLEKDREVVNEVKKELNTFDKRFCELQVKLLKEEIKRLKK